MSLKAVYNLFLSHHHGDKFFPSLLRLVDNLGAQLTRTIRTGMMATVSVRLFPHTTRGFTASLYCKSGNFHC